MKKIFVMLALFATCFLWTSCGDDDSPEEPTSTLLELLGEDENLSSLVAAVSAAGFTRTVEDATALTILAPTNTAFQSLLDSNDDWNALEDIDSDLLKDVLSYHLIGADVKSTDLATGYVNSNLAGPNSELVSLFVEVGSGVKFNNAATVTTADVAGTNGTYHIIDEVLLPPSVVDIALANSEFSTLVAALTREDLLVDFVSVLSDDGPFTVFAPNNAAFQALLDSNDDWASLDDIPSETLVAVLQYHVVQANVQSDELTDGQSVSALSGSFDIDLSDGAKINTSSGQTVSIIATDVQGTNGVVHVVESVLLP